MISFRKSSIWRLPLPPLLELLLLLAAERAASLP
jgi:hypothetical protein